MWFYAKTMQGQKRKTCVRRQEKLNRVQWGIFGISYEDPLWNTHGLTNKFISFKNILINKFTSYLVSYFVFG
jgi:hypothetical protein